MNLSIIIIKFTLYPYLTKQYKRIMWPIYQPFVCEHRLIIKSELIHTLMKFKIVELIFKFLTFLYEYFHYLFFHLRIILKVIFHKVTCLRFIDLNVEQIQRLPNLLLPRHTTINIIHNPKSILGSHNNFKISFLLFFIMSIIIKRLIRFFTNQA